MSIRVPRILLWYLVAGSALALGCKGRDPTTARATSALEEELVDTGPWLETVGDPPGSWQEVVEHREDVLRSRYVRFRQPESWPALSSRFVVRPFDDTFFIFRTRRTGPVGEDGQSWFGAVEGDPGGWGGVVVRPNGKVALSFRADGRRFEVVNVGDEAYAVLELTPALPLGCGTDEVEEG
jgi:hypothetical protein